MMTSREDDVAKFVLGNREHRVIRVSSTKWVVRTLIWGAKHTLPVEYNSHYTSQRDAYRFVLRVVRNTLFWNDSRGRGIRGPTKRLCP